MNGLQVFNHKDFGGIRALEIDGQPWFVGKDISDVLKYKNGSRDINRHVDAEDRQNYRNGTSEINNRGITIINISGVYSLILSSKLPKAREFRHWLTSVVLPSISKTGGYVNGNETDFIIKTVTATIMEQLPAIVSETVKATLSLISTGVQQPEQLSEKPKKRRINYHGKLDRLPVEVRNEVISMIFEKQYTYLRISNELRDKGIDVHLSSIGRLARRLADEVDGLPGIEIEI